MNINVTITGADESVEPSRLRALSRDFPFVEWGVLFSLGRVGTPRYPGSAWLDELKLVHDAAPQGLRLAAHLCGSLAREAMGGLARVGKSGLQVFDRVQLNGWSPDYNAQGFQRVKEYILQARSEDMLQVAATVAAGMAHVGQPASVLFDPSGGRGLEPFRWPPVPMDCRFGYAGGITPQNVETVIASIRTSRLCSNEPFWIDMESGVRDSDDRFSIDRVREVLERVASIRGCV
jgi:hypothetical protein